MSKLTLRSKYIELTKNVPKLPRSLTNEKEYFTDEYVDWLEMKLTSHDVNISDMEVKWLIYYGQKDKKHELIDKDGRIDYALISMFDLLKTNTAFNSSEVERIFWDRLKLLLNSR